MENQAVIEMEKLEASNVRAAKLQAEIVADRLFSAWNYYTIKDKDNTVGTIAIGKKRRSPSIVRGITICSIREKCDLNKGALQAIERMNEAALKRASFYPIRMNPEFLAFLRPKAKKPTNRKFLADYSVARFVKACDNNFFCKAEFKAIPTIRELGILERAAKYGR